MSLTETTQGTEISSQTSTSNEFIYNINTNMPLSKQIVFDTQKKYTDRNIKFQITMPGVVIPTPASGTSTFYITIGGVTYHWNVNSNGDVWVD